MLYAVTVTRIQAVLHQLTELLTEMEKTDVSGSGGKVEGVDYSPEGIEEIRKALIVYRNRSLDQWPEAIDLTVVLTHAIGLLSHYRSMMEEER